MSSRSRQIGNVSSFLAHRTTVFLCCPTYSLERIQGYIDIDHEPRSSEERKPPAAWPTSGNIVVENLSARYSKGGPTILHNISFSLESGQRIGIGD